MGVVCGVYGDRQFRWREAGPDGKRKHQSSVLSTGSRRKRQRVKPLALRLTIKLLDARLRAKPITELVEHYIDNVSWNPKRLGRPTQVATYEGYRNKWIVPQPGKYTLARVTAAEVELWLRSLALARSSCVKIRNPISVLFHYQIRYETDDRNQSD